MDAPLGTQEWKSNAEMVVDLARVGHFGETLLTVDATYGRGNWWSLFRPARLVAHDHTLDGVDFRALPEDDETFARAAFDPPYVSVGGRDTSGLGDFFDRYGLRNAPKGPKSLQRMMNDGLAEQARVVRPGGRIVMKCANYTSGGKFYAGVHETIDFGREKLGLVLFDQAIHVGDARPQPANRRKKDGTLSTAQHLRANNSVALVFAVPRRRKR